MNGVKFIRVLGIRANDPGVLAAVDGSLVKWNSRRGWACDCLTDIDEFECDHIEAVRNMLDDRVMTPISLKPSSARRGSRSNND